MSESTQFKWTLHQGLFLRNWVQDNQPSQAVEMLINEGLLAPETDPRTVLFFVHLAERLKQKGSVYDDILDHGISSTWPAEHPPQ